MLLKHRTAIGVFVMVFLCLINKVAFAAGSGAFRDETVDAQTLSMGNAFAGESNTPAAVYYNPAGLNQINSTTITLSDAVIAPRADFKNSTGDDFRCAIMSMMYPPFMRLFL